MWSLGSVVPSYIFISGNTNFFGFSIKAMASTKGKFAKLLGRLFLIGVGTPGILWIMASMPSSFRAIICSINYSWVGATFTPAFTIEGVKSIITLFALVRDFWCREPSGTVRLVKMTAGGMVEELNAGGMAGELTAGGMADELTIEGMADKLTAEPIF
ncbi:hypothetical protein CsatB_007643 [Cannabis sativa]|uniref:Uncharacterized protein n=1 Tax=Cannabis sativa TaxID=3483 RepID=A0A803NKD6_CANSA